MITLIVIANVLFSNESHFKTLETITEHLRADLCLDDGSCCRNFLSLGETMKVSLEYAQMEIEMKISCQKS